MGKNKEKTKEELRRKDKTSTWQKISIISIMILLISGTILVMSLNKEDDNGAVNVDINATQARTLANDFVKQNMMDVPNATIVDVEESGNLWKITFDLDNDGEQIVDAYVTRDGKYFIPAAYEINDDEIISGPVDSKNNNSNLENIPVQDGLTNILYFWGDGCGFCNQMNEFLDELEAEMPNSINVIKYETWNNEDNQDLMLNVASKYEIQPNGVPLVFIGDKYFVGSSDSIHNEIRDYIASDCLGSVCDLKI